MVVIKQELIGHRRVLICRTDVCGSLEGWQLELAEAEQGVVGAVAPGLHLLCILKNNCVGIIIQLYHIFLPS